MSVVWGLLTRSRRQQKYRIALLHTESFYSQAWIWMVTFIYIPAAAHLLRSWVRIPPGAWIFVYCECRVLSGRCLCDELITRPEESYRLCCVVVCDLETSRIGAPYIYDISSLRVNNLTLILLNVEKMVSS